MAEKALGGEWRSDYLSEGRLRRAEAVSVVYIGRADELGSLCAMSALESREAKEGRQYGGLV